MTPSTDAASGLWSRGGLMYQGPTANAAIVGSADDSNRHEQEPQHQQEHRGAEEASLLPVVARSTRSENDNNVMGEHGYRIAPVQPVLQPSIPPPNVNMYIFNGSSTFTQNQHPRHENGAAPPPGGGEPREANAQEAAGTDGDDGRLLPRTGQIVRNFASDIANNLVYILEIRPVRWLVGAASAVTVIFILLAMTFGAATDVACSRLPLLPGCGNLGHSGTRAAGDDGLSATLPDFNFPVPTEVSHDIMRTFAHQFDELHGLISSPSAKMLNDDLRDSARKTAIVLVAIDGETARMRDDLKRGIEGAIPHLDLVIWRLGAETEGQTHGGFFGFLYRLWADPTNPVRTEAGQLIKIEANLDRLLSKTAKGLGELIRIRERGFEREDPGNFGSGDTTESRNPHQPSLFQRALEPLGDIVEALQDARDGKLEPETRSAVDGYLAQTHAQHQKAAWLKEQIATQVTVIGDVQSSISRIRNDLGAVQSRWEDMETRWTQEQLRSQRRLVSDIAETLKIVIQRAFLGPHDS